MIPNGSLLKNQTHDMVDLPDSVHWNKVVSLLLLSTLSGVGTVGNIFAISAIMLEDQLKKRGNIFIVNLAIADFIVSAFAIPASSITILAGIPERSEVCHFQWFSAVLCCHVSVLSLLFIAVENYFRVGHPRSYNRWFSKINIIGMVSFVWIVSTTCVTLQFVLDLGPDYCAMKFRGVLTYHATVGSLLVGMPTLIAFVCYLKALFTAQRIQRELGNQSSPSTGAISPQPPENNTVSLVTLQSDYALLKTNFLVFIIFLLFWLPLGMIVIVGSTSSISRRVYNNFSWLALSNSCVNSFIYGLSNKPFRSAYINLFHYCCCKTSVSFGSRRPRESNRPHSDVRVHIIPGYNMYAPPRQPECKRHVMSSKPKSTKKDVYEL